MRKLASLLLLLSTANLLWAQNWQPIVPGNEYHYTMNNSGFITNVIKVDSIGMAYADSVFYLNRIVTTPDTAIGENGIYSCMLINQPQFLMRQVLKKDGGVFLFQDSLELLLKSQAMVGDSWLFCEADSIVAVLGKQEESAVFGRTDSVKHIDLSNGQTIILSKNYGLLEFPFNGDVFYLKGIKGQASVGQLMPDFWDSYDYEIGYGLRRSTSRSSGGLGIEGNSFSRFTYYIDSKEIFGDTISYQVHGTYTEYRYGVRPDTIEITKQLTYIDSVNHFANKYPGELVNLSYNLYYNLFSYVPSPLYSRVCVKEVDGRYYKYIDGANSCYNLKNDSLGVLFRDYYLPLVDEIVFECVEGMPISVDFYEFESRSGSSYSSIGIVGTEDQRKENRVQLYPSVLAKGEAVHVKSRSDIDACTVYSSSGALVFRAETVGSKFDFYVAKPGVYIAVLLTEGELCRRKFVVH